MLSVLFSSLLPKWVSPLSKKKKNQYGILEKENKSNISEAVTFGSSQLVVYTQGKCLESQLQATRQLAVLSLMCSWGRRGKILEELLILLLISMIKIESLVYIFFLEGGGI